MMEITPGKRERVTVKTIKTDTACTQICLKIVQYGGDTSRILTFTEALTAVKGKGRKRGQEEREEEQKEGERNRRKGRGTERSRRKGNREKWSETDERKTEDVIWFQSTNCQGRVRVCYRY